MATFFDPRQVINSRFGVSLALILGRTMPLRLGHSLTDWAGNWIAGRQGWGLVRAVRTNQWVVQGEKLDGGALDEAVRATFRNTARSIFEVNHYFHNLEAIRRLIVFGPRMMEILQRPMYAERGLVLVGIHMSNFDYVLQASGIYKLNALVLTLPEVGGGGYRIQYEMRRKAGVQLVPATMQTLRQSIEHLKAGGLVLTGIDRPVESPGYRPIFFGRPAALPVHHIFLALKARVPVVVGTTYLQPDGKYHLSFSDPIEMQPDPDRRREVLINAEAVLRAAEGFIRQAPEQWAMTFPVWPEALEEVPQ
jgi:lauroyl/myristoyl acyltransferase